MTILLKICDFIFVLRPLILVPAWSFYLIGAAQARDAQFSIQFGIPGVTVLVTLTSILVTAYLLNQIFDRESDEKNDKCFYLSRGIFRVRTLLILAAVFFMVASLAFRHVEEIHKAPLLVALALSLLYSLPPVRLCARPFADLAANAVGYGGIAYMLGYRTELTHLVDTLANAGPYVSLVASTFLHTTILDAEGDKTAEKISTTVYIGARASANLAVVLNAIAVVLALITSNNLAVIITAINLPVTIYALVNRRRQTSAVVVQASTLIVTVIAMILWPAYAIVVLPLVALSRFYHSRRFGITYPGVQKSV